MITVRVTKSETGDEDCLEDLDFEYLPRIGEIIVFNNFAGDDRLYEVLSVEYRFYSVEKPPSVLIRVAQR